MVEEFFHGKNFNCCIKKLQKYKLLQQIILEKVLTYKASFSIKLGCEYVSQIWAYSLTKHFLSFLGIPRSLKITSSSSCYLLKKSKRTSLGAPKTLSIESSFPLNERHLIFFNYLNLYFTLLIIALPSNILQRVTPKLAKPKH